MGQKILVVDDERAFLRLVDQVLTQQGYEVLTADNGQEALRILYAQKPDLVLLDVVMPGMDGWQTCQRIREISDVPIIMLTGKQKAEKDIVQGLEYGADEYLFKPVGNKELVARVRAVLRRGELPPLAEAIREATYTDGFLTVNIADRKVMVKEERVKLTPMEFRLFVLLIENKGRVLTHKQILEKVWGWEYTEAVDYVRGYIWHLRKKIEPDYSQPRYIMSEPGVGYYFQMAS